MLLVEADPDLQWRLARMLTLRGHRVVGTVSGDGASALMREWPVDVVLIADQLRDASGLEVARMLGQAYPDVPIVIMISQESPQLQLAAKLAGAVAVLIKPFRMEAFSQLLAGFSIAGKVPVPLR